MDNNEKLRPPYTSPGQAKAILDLFSRMTPKKIDSKFITNQKITTASNAFRVIDFLKWIGIIDEKGEVIEENAVKLKLVGEEKNKFLNNIIKEAYKAIFDMYDIDKIEKNDIINFFITEYSFGLPQSLQATGLFIYLCKEYGLPLNKKLLENVGTQTNNGNKRIIKKRINKEKIKSGFEKEIDNPSPEEIFEEIRIEIKGPEKLFFPFKAKTKEELDKIIDEQIKELKPALKLKLPSDKELKEKNET